MQNAIDDIKDMQETFLARITGKDAGWSAATKCLQCGKWWLWGVRDNLNFTCPDCKKV